MQSVTTRETPQGGETNKRGFPQSFTSKFTLQWCDSSSVNSIEMADPYIWRVTARRHLTVDTVPVTLLDIHLECDKVEGSSFSAGLIAVQIPCFGNLCALFLFCRLWHRGAIAQGLHQIQTNQIGIQWTWILPVYLSCQDQFKWKITEVLEQFYPLWFSEHEMRTWWCRLFQKSRDLKRSSETEISFLPCFTEPCSTSDEKAKIVNY